ncbi:MAG: hypothetical protein U0667_02850 [Chloroflexota bacterium]
MASSAAGRRFGLISGMIPSAKNELLYRDATDAVASITSYATSIADHPTGTPVCRIGLGSSQKSGFHARKCGEVSAWAQTNFSCKNPGGPSNNPADGCARIMLTMEVNFDSTGGDSGGTIWYGDTGTDGPMKLMGMHVHSDVDGSAGDDRDSGKHGWYTPVSQVLDGLEEKGHDIKVCTSASC